MKHTVKPIAALTVGAILLLNGLGQNVQAQSTITNIAPTTVTLADLSGSGTATGPNAITVLYEVTENPITDVYTYDYTVGNPAGDTSLVTSFSVGFNSSASGAVVGTPSGDGVVNGAIGVMWSPTIVAPGATSSLLSFQSDDAPTFGNANANGTTPFGPWASSPNGSTVPVPTVVPEPSTMMLFAGLLLLLPFRSAILKKV